MTKKTPEQLVVILRNLRDSTRPDITRPRTYAQSDKVFAQMRYLGNFE